MRELSKRGHEVRFDVGGYGGYQAIKVEMHDGQRVYVGASETARTGRRRDIKNVYSFPPSRFDA